MFLEFVAALALSATPTAEYAGRAVSQAPVQSTVAPGWTPIQFNNSTARATPPRWRGDICVGAVGLSAQQSQFIADRISQRAQAVGLNPGGPGCDANVLVVFTNNPNEVATDLLNSRDFSGRGRGRTPDLQNRDEFTNSRRPIRWWYVWQSVLADGQVVNPDNRAGQPANVRAPERGRTGRNTRQELTHAFVVIDGAQIAQTNMNAVADYAAMVALARVGYDTQTGGQPSILGLFTDTQPQTALTAWDLAHLQDYYRAPQ